MDYHKQKHKIAEHFAESLARAADEHGAVDSSARSHEKRFAKIAEVGALEGTRVLDVGCALGAFHAYLVARNISCDYTGYDITESMIVRARERFPEIADRFQVKDILDGPEPSAEFDYVVAVSPLNLPMDGVDNVEVTVQLVARMLKLARVGAAICMTSSFTRRPGADTFYYDPAVMLDRLSALTRNIRLDHTYLPHDFAVFCYNRDLYDV